MMSNPFAFAQVRMWLTPVVLRWLNVAARGLMLALFVYTASQKIASPDVFRKELAYSPLIPSSLATITFYLLPLSEFGIVCLLLFDRLQKAGFFLSFVMMLAFTAYLAALYVIFANPPCACGGILGGMSYPLHIAFNIFFVLVALVGIYTSEGSTDESGTSPAESTPAATPAGLKHYHKGN